MRREIQPLPRALGVLGFGVQVLLCLPLGYLGVLTVAGLLPPRTRRPGGTGMRLVVLVPARNEERSIGTTVASLRDQGYSADQLRLLVLADNCTDATADVARQAGAQVWERHGLSQSSKGKALHWAVEQLLGEQGWDALVVVDADTIVDAGFLAAVAERLGAGSAVVQGEYRVANPGDSLVARLTEVSFAVQSVLRQRGRAALGGAAKLQGNGMAFRRDVLERHPWDAAGLAEDVEYWLGLLEHGIYPTFEPAAVVRGLMPSTLSAARVQRARWDTGRAHLVRSHRQRVLRVALRRRDPVLGEAVVSELVFPPLSTTAALVAAAAVMRWVGNRTGRGAAALQTGVLVVHVLAGLRVSRAPLQSYAAVTLAPLVVGWKLVNHARARLAPSSAAWVGTPREGPRS